MNKFYNLSLPTRKTFKVQKKILLTSNNIGLDIHKKPKLLAFFFENYGICDTSQDIFTAHV